MPFNGSIQTINTRKVRNARLDEELEAEVKTRQDALNGEPEEPEVPNSPAAKEEAKGWEKRHNDMKSFMQKQINELKADNNRLKEQLLNNTAQVAYPKTKEEVKEWLDTFPDLGAIVETIAMEKAEAVRSELNEQKADLKAQKFQIKFDFCFNKIMAAHDDFIELRDTDEFIEWLQKQPKATRSAFEPDIELEDLEDAADTIIAAVELYKLKTTKKPQKRVPDTDTRDAARQVLTRQTSAAPTRGELPDNYMLESEVVKMRDRDFTDEFEAEMNKAIAEGRFIYDVTGAAR